MNVLLVYPQFPDTFWSFKHALDFVGKRASAPPLGLLTVAAMLPKEWKLKLVDMNVTRLKDRDLDWCDMVFISAMTVQRSSVNKVITLAKAHKRIVVAGGPLFTGEWEAFDEVDHFVLNEAELTLAPFLRDLEAGNAQHVYASDDYADIQQTPIPMWSLLNLSHYNSMNLQFSRGCPFNCEFCNVTALLGHRPRTKTATQLVAELDSIYALGWRRTIFIVDDNFIGNKRVLKEEIMPALIDWRKDKEGCLFLTEASINLADDEELMDMMAKAGFTQVFVGIETPDEAALTEANKKQNKGRDLVDAVWRLQKKGLQVMGGFIVGFDSDNETIFQRMIDFIQRSGIITAMVGLLQAPVGTRLYHRMGEAGRLIDTHSGDNVDGSSNIKPVMDEGILKRGYKHILQEVYSPRLFYQRVRTFLEGYKPLSHTVYMGWEEIRAFLHSIYKLGIIGEERREYWRLFFWTLGRFPKKLPLAITMAIYGYHFRRVSLSHVV